MGTFKLGKMTFGSLFKKPETVMYPSEKKPQPEGLKGHIAIDTASCILCGMCDRSCSTNCITVDKKLRYWEIQRFQCVQCGYCITVCPKKCLSMHPDYASAATEQKPDRFEIPEQAKSEKNAKIHSAEAKSQVNSTQATVSDGSSSYSNTKGDEQIEMLLSRMDPEKAKKVRAAFV